MLLKLYSSKELVKLFERETGGTVDEIFVSEFKRWLMNRESSISSPKLPLDYHLWLISRVHEYFSDKCCL